MLTIAPLSPRAIGITASRHFSREDTAAALSQMPAILDEMPHLDILADVQGSPSFALSAVAEEFRHLPLIFRLIRQVERVAIVADAPWIRTVSRIEGALIPGVHYEVYERQDADHARAWLLRQTDVPRPDA